ncbi:MAG: CBS domain-containing protein [Thermoplasmata archaeon]|nr:MAG: CBS domain-containing protein [Thermoplasmata archaeon]
MVTERDVLTKVVAEGKDPKNVKLEDIMSSPLISIEPKTTLYEAAKKMALLNIRRLPIMDGGKLVGVITETDLLKISPELIEITREFVAINDSLVPGQVSGLAGYCESCKSYSTELTLIDDMLLCPRCAEMRR